MWSAVRPCYASCPVPPSTDYWTNPTLGYWQPANHRVGGTPTAALRAGPNVAGGRPRSDLRSWSGIIHDSAVRAQRRTPCQGTQTAILSARSAAVGVPPITWLVSMTPLARRLARREESNAG